MISRMSKLPNIEPLYAISVGNQIDLTISDYLNYFKASGIHRLQDINNPLDTTPVADDSVFSDLFQAMIDDKTVDCAIVSPVPMTPAMQTLVPGRFHEENLYHPKGIVMRLIDIFHKTEKPFVVNLDAGDIFKPMSDCLEQAGVPTFRRSDIAVKFLRKYINNRLIIRKKYGN